MKYIVYALIDPRSDNMFYIGKSCSGISKAKRHTQNWSLRDSNTEKNNIIKSIVDDGLSVVVRVLETSRCRRSAEMKERVLIARYRDILSNKRVG